MLQASALTPPTEAGRESDMGRVINGLQRETSVLRDNVGTLIQRLMPLLNPAKPTSSPGNVKAQPGSVAPVVEALEQNKHELNNINTEVLELLERLSI